LRNLKKRRLCRVAVTYVVIAWLAVQVADVLLPALFLPEWGVRLILILALLGFAPAMLIAWALEPSEPSGLATSARSEPALTRPGIDGRHLDLIVIAVLVVLIGILLWALPQPDDAGGPAFGSIAVLPFTELSSSGEAGYLGDGLAGELLNALTRLDGLRVAARTSSFAFRDAGVDVREIGRRLNVDAVIEGTLRRDADRVRVTIQLIDVRDGFNVWSEDYSERADDILALQENIANSVVGALRRGVLAERGSRHGIATRSAEAYARYLEGRAEFHARTPASLERAVALFEDAIDRDPEFALAYTGLADAQLLRVTYANEPLADARQSAEAAIARALALEDGLAEAYASLGLLKSHAGQPGAAEQAYRRAVQLNPNYSMAHMWLGGLMLNQGRLRDASQAFSRARNLDPLHPVVNGNLASTLMAMGHYEAGMSIFERALQQSPRAATLLLQMAKWAGEFGRLDQSLAFARRAHALDPAGPLGRIAMARSNLWLGDMEAARHWLELAEAAGADNLRHMEQRAAFHQEAGQYALLDAYATAWLDDLSREQSNPPDYHARIVMGWAGIGRLLVHDYDTAIDLLERSLQADEGQRRMEDARTLVYLALAYARSAREADARAALAEAGQLVDRGGRQGAAWPRVPLLAAEVAALDGRPEEALDLLRQAVDAGWRRFGLVENHLAFAALRNDDRYRALIRQMRSEVSAMRGVFSGRQPAPPGRDAIVD
jgi:TolB-like protein/Tfp pilus assembly protein PilF